MNSGVLPPLLCASVACVCSLLQAFLTHAVTARTLQLMLLTDLAAFACTHCHYTHITIYKVIQLLMWVVE